MERRVAVVTGAGGGWGGDVADAFVAAGWQVVAPHRGRAPERPDGAVLPVAADLADPHACERVAAEAVGRFGRIDALANIAGGFESPGRMHEVPAAAFGRQLQTNLLTAFHMTRAVLPALLEGGGGSVVFVGSAAAARPFPGAAGYLVSKAAVVALMQVVDAEARRAGVRANAIVPAIVDTARNRAGNPDADHARWAKGPDLARVVVWLCGDDSRPLSGAAIPVHGTR